MAAQPSAAAQVPLAGSTVQLPLLQVAEAVPVDRQQAARRLARALGISRGRRT